MNRLYGFELHLPH